MSTRPNIRTVDSQRSAKIKRGKESETYAGVKIRFTLISIFFRSLGEKREHNIIANNVNKNNGVKYAGQTNTRLALKLHKSQAITFSSTAHRQIPNKEWDAHTSHAIFTYFIVSIEIFIRWMVAHQQPANANNLAGFKRIFVIHFIIFISLSSVCAMNLAKCFSSFAFVFVHKVENRIHIWRCLRADFFFPISRTHSSTHPLWF